MTSKSKECGERHNITALSYSTAFLTAGISLSTVALNGLIIIVYIQNHKLLFKRLFYKVIFNVIVCDFLNGLITDNLTLAYVIKEGTRDSISRVHVTFSHLTFFVFGAVSVVTIGILGIERQWAVLLPFSYRIGIRDRILVAILMSTWLFAISMSLLYLFVGFYTSLAIFASTTVALSFMILIITASVYYRKLVHIPTQLGSKVEDKVIVSRSSISVQNIMTEPVRNERNFKRSVSDQLDARLSRHRLDDALNKSTSGMERIYALSTATTAEARNNAMMPSQPKRKLLYTSSKEKNSIQPTEEVANSTELELHVRVHSEKPSKVTHIEPRGRPETITNTLQNCVPASSNDKLDKIARESQHRLRAEKRQVQRCRRHMTEVEKRATRTFMVILIVYIISYLPTCIMMIYMNICKHCGCLVLHVLRDMTFLSMVSSCLLRPINFLWSLKPLREGMRRIFKKPNRLMTN